MKILSFQRSNLIWIGSSESRILFRRCFRIFLMSLFWFGGNPSRYRKNLQNKHSKIGAKTPLNLGFESAMGQIIIITLKFWHDMLAYDKTKTWKMSSSLVLAICIFHFRKKSNKLLTIVWIQLDILLHCKNGFLDKLKLLKFRIFWT